MRHVSLLFLALLGLILAPLSASAAADREYIVICGGVSLHEWERFKAQPHDNWWANFVRASRIRIQQIREQDPEAQITWLVYRPSYSARIKQENGADLFGNIASVRDAYNTKLVYFDKTSQLIDYINNGQPRDRVKICNLEYFGHSNKACWMFDYSNNIDSASKVWLHENELGQIRRGIFTRDAMVKSWGCHTGESMSRKFKAATGVPMVGAIGKTQYMTEELPILSSTSGRWVR